MDHRMQTRHPGTTQTRTYNFLPLLLLLLSMPLTHASLQLDAQHLCQPTLHLQPLNTFIKRSAEILHQAINLENSVSSDTHFQMPDGSVLHILTITTENSIMELLKSCQDIGTVYSPTSLTSFTRIRNFFKDQCSVSSPLLFGIVRDDRTFFSYDKALNLTPVLDKGISVPEESRSNVVATLTLQNNKCVAGYKDTTRSDVKGLLCLLPAETSIDGEKVLEGDFQIMKTKAMALISTWSEMIEVLENKGPDLGTQMGDNNLLSLNVDSNNVNSSNCYAVLVDISPHLPIPALPQSFSLLTKRQVLHLLERVEGEMQNIIQLLSTPADTQLLLKNRVVDMLDFLENLKINHPAAWTLIVFCGSLLFILLVLSLGFIAYCKVARMALIRQITDRYRRVPVRAPRCH